MHAFIAKVQHCVSVTAAAFGGQDIGLQSNFRGPSGQQGPYGSSGKPSIYCGLLGWCCMTIVNPGTCAASPKIGSQFGIAFMPHCAYTLVCLHCSFSTLYLSSQFLSQHASCFSDVFLPFSLFLTHVTMDTYAGHSCCEFCCSEGPTLCLA